MEKLQGKQREVEVGEGGEGTEGQAEGGGGGWRREAIVGIWREVHSGNAQGDWFPRKVHACVALCAVYSITAGVGE